jgi:hypothetical protein
MWRVLTQRPVLVIHVDAEDYTFIDFVSGGGFTRRECRVMVEMQTPVLLKEEIVNDLFS